MIFLKKPLCLMTFMKLVLGLFFFSILLTTGNSLVCEHCVSPTSETCSGLKKNCPDKNYVCMTLKTETKILLKITTVMKTCSLKDSCKQLQEQKGNILPSSLPNMTDSIPSFQTGAVIKEVICSKAPPSFAWIFPAFLGLLPMKLLF